MDDSFETVLTNHCPFQGRHALPEGAAGMITGDEHGITELLSGVYADCEYCKEHADARFQCDAGNGYVLLCTMTAIWLCSHAQVRASQGLPPVDTADLLFPPAMLRELSPRTRRVLRRILLFPCEAPGGRPAAQPDPLDMADVLINHTNGLDRWDIWLDALDGAVSIVMMEASRG
ncbi:hypothetical protein OG819_53225 [Streptomyces sp. NBC_01549]|uniref:hypothetical protein n=2 Tax=unclassified Streptomyces TaxID=2593676 RepID=UPI00225858D5|nr:hypothetical protein [Streptomyces sp. NBC_01549]MCX4597977.1 hypothetical protein [Streptomyces sp. NBC_01549]